MALELLRLFRRTQCCRVSIMQELSIGQTMLKWQNYRLLHWPRFNVLIKDKILFDHVYVLKHWKWTFLDTPNLSADVLDVTLFSFCRRATKPWVFKCIHEIWATSFTHMILMLFNFVAMVIKPAFNCWNQNPNLRMNKMEAN